MNSRVSNNNPTVVFQGLSGSFSSMAARLLYGSEIHSLHTVRFRDIFDRVMDGAADIGIVPIENAVAGSVHENYDLLAEYPCSIVAETFVSVQLHLLGTRSAAQLSKVYSHPKALEQCSLFFERHPHLEGVVWSDTAGAAKHIATLADPSVGAIASEEAANLHSLAIVKRSIQNHLNNSTRFVAISKTPTCEHAPTKCSLIAWLANKPGALHALVHEVAQLQLNLTKIESRPVVGAPFSYSFHIDIECTEDQSSVLREVPHRIAQVAERLKVLGLYRAHR